MASRPLNQHGIVLLTILVFILVTTLAASGLVVMYDTQRKREREAELLFVGSQYRRAIASYYNTIPPGGARALPTSLEALLEDSRFPTPVHHLRRLYPDPVTGKNDWNLIRSGGGIVGVSSQSALPPLKQSNFEPGLETLEGKAAYSEWKFVVPVP